MQTTTGVLTGGLLCVVIAVACVGHAHQQVTASGQGAYEPSLAVLEDGFLVGWHDTRDGNPEIYARALSADGVPRSPEWRLTTSVARSYEPDVAVAGGGFAVAWYDVTNSESRVRLGMWEDNGQARWERTLSAVGGNARNPVVVSDADRLFTAWLEHDAQQWAVWACWVDVEGRAQTSPVRVATASETTWNLNAALDTEGTPWVIFDASLENAASELFAAKIREGGVHVAQLTGDDGALSAYPDIAFGTAGAAVVWFDERDGNREVYLAAAPVEALPQAITDHATRVTHTPGESIGAYVSWNGAEVGVAWSDDTEGNPEVYFQRFAADGSTIHSPLRVTRNSTSSWVPAIQSADHGFALSWNEDVVELRGSHGEDGRSEVAFALIP